MFILAHGCERIPSLLSLITFLLVGIFAPLLIGCAPKMHDSAESKHTIEESMIELEYNQAKAELLLNQAEQDFEARKHEMTESEIQQFEDRLRIAKDARRYLQEQTDIFMELTGTLPDEELADQRQSMLDATRYMETVWDDRATELRPLSIAERRRTLEILRNALEEDDEDSESNQEAINLFIREMNERGVYFKLETTR